MKARYSDSRNGKSFVSVVIPTFNAQAHLLLLLESLRNQSVMGFEVIVVDDGSNDGTREAVAKMMEHYPVSLRYYYLDNTDIFGAGMARNCGAKHATGDILLFLDQDCVAEKDLVRRHVEHHKTKNIILGYFAGYGNEKRCYKFSRLKEYVQKKETIPILKEFRDQLFRNVSDGDSWKCFVSAHFSIKKEIFEGFCFDESFIQWGGQDVDLGYRLFKDGNVINFEKDCIVYNSWEGFKYTKQKVLSLSKSLIYTYRKYQTEDIKLYCLERFYHTPLKYRRSLQLIFRNNKFEIQGTETDILIDENFHARIALGQDFLDAISIIEDIIPLVKSVHFDVSVIKMLKKSSISDFRSNFHRLIKVLRDNKKNINLTDIR